MTGADVRRARAALRLDPFLFAHLLGVHVSSIYRWEKSRKVVLAPLHEQILTTLLVKLDMWTEAEREVRSNAVRAALLGGGTLHGLHELLDRLTEGSREKILRA